MSFCVLKVVRTKCTQKCYVLIEPSFMDEADHGSIKSGPIQSYLLLPWSIFEWHCIPNNEGKCRIQIRHWIHNTHPIAHPHRWAMECLLWIIGRKFIELQVILCYLHEGNIVLCEILMCVCLCVAVPTGYGGPAELLVTQQHHVCK